MAETNVGPVDLESIQDLQSKITSQTPNLTPEQLVVLINTDRVRTLEAKSKTELKILTDRYADVRALNDLRKRINNSLVDGSKGLDITKDENLRTMIEKAESLGVPIVDGKTFYTREESERLEANIKMTIDDLNVQNELQMQQVSRLQNEYYESFQLAMSIIKPIHTTKSNMIRGMAGR